MRISYIIIILALLFLFPEKSNSQNFHFPAMQISDALPVQFWLTGCATYNEHFADGVHHKCYCAPVECDDEILIQFTDDPSQNFSLLVFNESGGLLDELDIEEVQIGVYQLAYIPSGDGSPDLCNERIQLKIRRDQGLQGISLPALNTWLTNTGSANPDWTLGANPNVNLPGTFVSPSTSEFLYTDYAFIPGVTYNITLNFTRVTNSGTSNPRTAQIVITDGSFTVEYLNNIAADNGENTIEISFLATSNTTRIAFTYTSGMDVTISVTSVSGQRTVGDSEIVAKTDCLDIRQSHENTVLLSYSNVRNFAGLVYSGNSPDVTFQIRIPAIFFHQRFPEEDEVMELSSELVTLNGTVRKQRLLDVDYVPYYSHEKFKLILKHQILTVFNRQWVKQEAYEITEGDRRWPMKKAKCWISEKDFVHRNIL